MTHPRPDYRPHIDGLRAIAVLGVLVFHAFPDVLPGGFAGVDVFFVISGFLITRILLTDCAEAKATFWSVIGRFYARRVRRIFPALLAVLVGCLIYAFFYSLPEDLVTLGFGVAQGMGFCLNLVLAAKAGYFAPEAASHPLLHLWSLGVEEQFYLVWPLVVWLCWRLNRRFLPIAIFLAATSYFWNAQKPELLYSASFFLPQTRLWELAIGAIAAAWPLGAATNHLVRWRRPAGHAAALVGLVLVLGSLLRLQRAENYPNASALVPTLGAALLVLSPAWAWTNRWLLANRAMVAVGLVSYPLYLWHWPLLVMQRINAGTPPDAAERVGALVVAGLLAWITYRFVETPLRSGRRRASVVAGLLGAGTVVAALGLAMGIGKGFPGRLSPTLRAVAAYRFDPAVPWREGTYFLVGDQDSMAFKPSPQERVAGKPTIYLWGDSYAAALYPGLVRVYGAKYNVVERAAAGTPPLAPADFPPGNAPNISSFVLSEIAQDNPEIVVLTARWQRYDWAKVAGALALLHQMGIRRVILVGQAPEWTAELPRQVYLYVWKHPSRPAPLRLPPTHTPGIDAAEAGLPAIAKANGAEFVSLMGILCNADGALVRTGEGIETLTSFDSGHLTTDGSIYVAVRFPSF